VLIWQSLQAVALAVDRGALRPDQGRGSGARGWRVRSEAAVCAVAAAGPPAAGNGMLQPHPARPPFQLTDLGLRGLAAQVAIGTWRLYIDVNQPAAAAAHLHRQQGRWGRRFALRHRLWLAAPARPPHRQVTGLEGPRSGRRASGFYG